MLKWILLASLIILILLFIVYYNRFVTMRARVQNAWGQIDVQLKRRSDLIPNLVNTVKGYAHHESGTLEAIVQARSNAHNARSTQERIQAENDISQAMSRLMVLSESYPDLKANANFGKLQDQLEQTEDKISYMRQSLNDTVYLYNTAIQQFPGNIVARLGGFELSEQYELLDPVEREAPLVNFD